MFGNRHNDNNYNNHGYPRSNNGYYDEYDQSEDTGFWGSDDDDFGIEGFHKWMMIGIASLLMLLVLTGIFGKQITSFFDVLRNNHEFNRYFFTYLTMVLIVAFSKKGWRTKRPYFGLRKTIILASFLMIGYGAVTSWLDIVPMYDALLLVEYPDEEILFLLNNAHWDIVKFSAIIYLITVTSWRIIEASFFDTKYSGTLSVLTHLIQAVFFGILAAYIIEELKLVYWNGTGMEVLFYFGTTGTSIFISWYELNAMIQAWNKNNDDIANSAIEKYQSKVVELADRTMRERKEQFNSPEHHKNYGDNFNTVIELKGITEAENMVFEMDGSKENVLLRIPEGLKVLINIQKVPEVEVHDIEKTKVVRNIIQSNRTEAPDGN